MFSLDKILLEFVGANWMSIYVLITLAKGAAMLTKSTTDDKIVTLFANMYKGIRKGKVPDEIPTIPVDAPKGPTEETLQTSDTIR